MSMMCSAIHVALQSVGVSAITGPLGAHVESCVPCRGDVLRNRTMHRELETLDSARYRAPRGLAAAVMSDLGPVAVEMDGPRRDPRVPVAAAAVVATAAAGTAVLYHLYRQRAA